MAELWGVDPAEATARVYRASRVPTQYLGGTTHAHQARRRAGLSGALPRVPAVVADAAEQAAWQAFRATQRRRRLLAIFARMMARFHERHERHWSMGRWECVMCHKRIAAWAWLPHGMVETATALHEECVSRSMWDMVLHHERLARATRSDGGLSS
jgi:hypothetical protein